MIYTVAGRQHFASFLSSFLLVHSESMDGLVCSYYHASGGASQLLEEGQGPEGL